ncbi:L,D-transpeptidase LdtMt5 [Gordonia jinhuaensis]
MTDSDHDADVPGADVPDVDVPDAATEACMTSVRRNSGRQVRLTTVIEDRKGVRHFREVLMSRRRVLGVLGAGAVAVTAAACGTKSESASTASTSKTPPPPVAQITYSPQLTAVPSPTAPISAKVSEGTFNTDVKLTNARGTVVKTELSDDRTTVTVAEPLGYGVQYTWSGTATGTDRKTVPLQGAFTTLDPQSQVNVVINIADGASVGIAAPLILKFDSDITDKAAVEKALKVTTTPATEGGWAWLPDDNGSRAHWRPKEYWAPGTTVAMVGKLYGLDHGDGAYGASDVTSNFTIGRSQIVKADANTHQIVVVTNGSPSATYPCSYGEGDVDRNVTRTGIHVVSEKHPDFYMSNPAAGYFNVHERWAVRISNNGEFIHANPNTVGVQGSSNVTNGCINLSTDNAESYFNTAIYGDPVEVTNTRIDLSAADGDIYDWTIDWPTWQSMSALVGGDDSSSQDAPATPSDAPKLSPAPAG